MLPDAPYAFGGWLAFHAVLFAGGGELLPKIEGEFQLLGGALPFTGGALQPFGALVLGSGGALIAIAPGFAIAVLAVPGGGIVDWP